MFMDPVAAVSILDRWVWKNCALSQCRRRCCYHHGHAFRAKEIPPAIAEIVIIVADDVDVDDDG